jgi:hypothetical protein
MAPLWSRVRGGEHQGTGPESAAPEAAQAPCPAGVSPLLDRLGSPGDVKTYARWYGVDRYAAYVELGMVGVHLRPEDARWGVHPPSSPALRPPSRFRTVARVGMGRGWGVLMFPVGYTEGGMPFGLTLDDLDPRNGRSSLLSLVSDFEDRTRWRRRAEPANISRPPAFLRDLSTRPAGPGDGGTGPKCTSAGGCAPPVPMGTCRIDHFSHTCGPPGQSLTIGNNMPVSKRKSSGSLALRRCAGVASNRPDPGRG